MADKIIVTNVAQLKQKYGAGYSKVAAAITALIAADKNRHIVTTLIDMMAASTKSTYGTNVTKALDPKQNKTTIDAIYAKDRPAYLMILGAPDVVPHQPLTNPVNASKTHDPDEDRFVPSDLPYACNHPYSKDPGDFLAVTRVVGRLPDLMSGTNPAYIAGLLNTAATYRSRPATDYHDYLGLTALAWQASTDQSLRNIFGTAHLLCTSPLAGPVFTNAQWKTRSHFINCHGASAAHEFYGDDGAGNLPPCHDALLFSKKVAPGTVASAECCYGAELYDPAVNGSSAGICNIYLAEGAYAFFGSTNIAYGPSAGNSAADLICQDFLWHTINGSSTGRATLDARQTFVRKNAMADPINLKTLAQFLLLGDPSVHPVTPPAQATTLTAKGGHWVAKSSNGDARVARRLRAETVGSAIGATAAKPRLASVAPAGANIKSLLTKTLASLGAKSVNVKTMKVDAPKPSFAASGLTKKAMQQEAPVAVHVAIGNLDDVPVAEKKINRLVALVALETKGKMEMKTYYSR